MDVRRAADGMGDLGFCDVARDIVTLCDLCDFTFLVRGFGLPCDDGVHRILAGIPRGCRKFVCQVAEQGQLRH